MSGNVLNRIPEGAEVRIDDIRVAVTNKELLEGHCLIPGDFTPEIEKGTRLETMEIWFAGKLIYKHPNFIHG